MNVNKKLVSEITIGVISASAGLTAGYILAKKKFEKQANEAIQSVKETYDRRYKSGDYSSPSTALEAVKELQEEREDIEEQLDDFTEEIAKLGYSEVDPDVVPGQPQTVILEEGITPVVLPEVDSNKPYVITIEDFHDSEWDHFEKISLTYYEGDETLCDDRDEIIPDILNAIGDGYLHFGEGSQDDDQVYIRNGKLYSDFEVTRSKGEYAQEVRGEAPDLERHLRLRTDG